MRHNKKIIIVLVEGRSEIEALRHIISSLFDDCYNGLFNVEFIAENEDVTSRKGIIPRCIESWISNNYVIPFLNKNFLSEDDVRQIIQITDLDGAYIDESLIIEDLSLKDIQYNLNKIMTKNRDNIVKRNINKKKNLDYLVQCEKFKLYSKEQVLRKIPFRIFYFSSNLDHFLYDIANLSSVEKVSKAISFAQETSPHKFEEMFLDEGIYSHYVAKNQTYFESWEYVRQSTNSLNRFSNINILIDEILSGSFLV